MSNGTRKKVLNFKKLLVNDEDNIPLRKKSFKPNYSNQNNSHKKDKNSKNLKNQRENQSKAPEKPSSKKPKTRNCKKKEQLSLSEFTNKLNEYKDEFSFLQKKRNSDINIEKILSFQNNNQNKVNSALINNNNDIKTQNSNSKNKKSVSMIDINNNKNINEMKNDLNKNNTKKEIDNGNSTLIIDFYKLYYHLFESNRLDNSKPYKFVDYLIAGDNLLFNLKKDKNRFEEIKKGITLKQKNNSLINEQLLNKSIYEYLRCDFSNCFMKKIAEKVNEFLMNRYISKKKEKNSVENSLCMEKKDKFTYSNFLSDKLKDNTNKSCLSFTNDTDYIKSLIYVCNKYSKYIGKKEVPEKILIESLEKNKKILENFKNSEEGEEEAKKIEMGYLKDLLHNKSIRKYLSKKLKTFNRNKLENNEILSNLDIDNFYKILNIIIKNKNDDDIDKLYKLFEDNLSLNENNKLDKNNLRNFIILLKFLFELSLANKLKDDIKLNNEVNENNVLNNISLLREIYENISKNQLDNKPKLNGSENNSIHTNGQKIKGKNRLRIKKIKDNKNIKIEEKEDINSKNKNSSENIINNIELNENENSNNIDKNSINNNNTINNSNSESKNKKRNIKNSKIVSFKVPQPSKNNFATKANNNNGSLFEINNKSELNINKNSNQIKTEEINKNNNSNIIEKAQAHFETFNDTKKENVNIKEKENTRGKKRKKRNTEENKENSNNTKNTKNEIIEAKIDENSEHNLINNYMTFYSMNHTIKKELNLGRYILNKLSSGQDIFKLIIEKPKIKKSKDKEQSENSQSKEKDKDKEIEKDTEKEKEIEKEKENELEKNNENKNDNNENNENSKVKRRRRRIKKDKTKAEDLNLKVEEDKKEIKIENDDNTKIKYDKGTNMDIEKEESEEKNEDKNNINNNNDEKEIIINNKEINNNNNKKGYETRENSSKSKNEVKIYNMGIDEIKSSNFNHKNEEERNIDIINFNNYMFKEGEPIKEITRNDLKHSPNICIKICQKNAKKNNELIFNISNQNNQNNKFLVSTNTNNCNLETKSKIRKNKKVSFKNINIQIAHQSIEIKGGNFIPNKKDNQNEDIIKIKDYFNDI